MTEHTEVVSTTIKDADMNNVEALIDMREHITDQAAYARMLAEDGAYQMAANCLRDLYETIQHHANTRAGELKKFLGASE